MFLVYLLLILLLGVGLLIFGIRKLSGKLRKFVILTGSSAVGFFVFVHLHNLVYGLFIHLLGRTSGTVGTSLSSSSSPFSSARWDSLWEL